MGSLPLQPAPLPRLYHLICVLTKRCSNLYSSDVPNVIGRPPTQVSTTAPAYLKIKTLLLSFLKISMPVVQLICAFTKGYLPPNPSHSLMAYLIYGEHLGRPHQQGPRHQVHLWVWETIIWPWWAAHDTAEPPSWHCVPVKAEEKSCV